jgi:leucyl aminopeptidase
MDSKIYIIKNIGDLPKGELPSHVVEYFATKLKDDVVSASTYTASGLYAAEILKEIDNAAMEKARKNGAKLFKQCLTEKCTTVSFVNISSPANTALALVEGFMLSNYKFENHLSKKSDFKIDNKNVCFDGPGSEDFSNTKTGVEAVHIARQLVNEPVNHLNAQGIADAFVLLGNTAGFSVEVWNEAKIESQKMGGLLAVNKGSQDPPTFSILEYKPNNAVNSEPYVLIGKGVVFDTGGLSLKPTPNSMDFMKSDMGGAAVVGASMYGIAKMALPIWVVGLVPATDNRPGENAICPGDIITTYSGHTVEVLNTDAEGRLILCDALAYAKKYKPKLVFDFATLTGAAARAIGEYGTVFMGTADDSIKNKLKETGESTYERLVELPIWPEYEEEMKGDISDLKNLGKGEGGAQSAGAYLKQFTDYPWMHFDIAPSAYLHSAKDYRTKGGTGVCVRLMLNYFKNLSNG